MTNSGIDIDAVPNTGVNEVRQSMTKILIANQSRATVLLVLMAVVMSAGVASAQTQPPQIFFTDLDSGPNAGGENMGGTAGAYVTIYGNFLYRMGSALFLVSENRRANWLHLYGGRG